MSGWLTNGLINLLTATGAELLPLDLPTAAGAAPLTGAMPLETLANVLDFYSITLSKTMVAGTRYTIGPFTIGQATGGEDVITQSAPLLLNGVNVKVGGTGGTDSWIGELHSSTGALLATSNTAGVTAGTANEWMQLPFYSGSANTPYSAAPGVYYISLQSNGTTATFAAINSPTYPLFTGSSPGTFGTGASITPPTTYTLDLGPKVFLY
jgi:hypothetical protein